MVVCAKLYGARVTVPAETPFTKNSTLPTTASDIDAVERRKKDEFCGMLAPDAGAMRLSTRTAPTVTITDDEVAVLVAEGPLSTAVAVRV